MAPQVTAAVDDDEDYGLEKVKPQSAASTNDEYGLEPLGAPKTAPAAPKVGETAASQPGAFQTKRGGPIQFAPPEEEGALKRLTRAGATGFSTGVTGMPESTTPFQDVGADIKKQVKEFGEHPISTIAGKGLFGPAPALYGLGKGLFEGGAEMGHGLAESLHLAPGTPEDEAGNFVGPERVAHGAGGILGTLMQLGILKGIPTAEDVGTIRRSLTTPRIPAPGLSAEATGTLIEPNARRGNELFFRGVRPSGSNHSFRESLAIATPDLREIELANPLGKSEAGGGIVKPDYRLRQTATNIDAKLDDIWNKERQPQIDRHGDAHVMNRQQLMRGFTPDEQALLERKLDTTVPDNLDLNGADALLKKVNARLRNAESLTPEGKALALELSPVLDKLNDLKRTLHDNIGRTLTDYGEPGIKEFNKRYGALSDVRDSVSPRANTAEADRALDDIRASVGSFRGPGILERLHIKASPGRLVQQGLEDIARAPLQRPPAPTGSPAQVPFPYRLPAPTPEPTGGSFGRPGFAQGNLPTQEDTSGLLGQAALPTPLVWSPEMREAIARETPLRPPEAAVTQEGIGSVENPEAVGTRGEEGTRFGPKGLLPAPQPGVEPYLNERPEAVNPANRPLRVETPNRTEAVGVLPTLTGPIQDRMWGGMGTQGAQPGMLGFALPEQELMGQWGPTAESVARGTSAGVAEPPKEPLNYPRQDLPQGGLPLKAGEDIQGELAKTREQSRADRRRATLSSASQAIEEDINRPERAEGMMGAAEARPQYTYKPSEKAATMSAERRPLGKEFEKGEGWHEADRNNAILDNPQATPEDKAAAQAFFDKNPEARTNKTPGGTAAERIAARKGGAAAPARGTFAPEVEPPEVVADKAKELGLIWHDPGGAMRGMYESFSDPQTGHTLNIKVKDLSPEALQTKVEQARAAGSSVPETLKGKVGPQETTRRTTEQLTEEINKQSQIFKDPNSTDEQRQTAWENLSELRRTRRATRSEDLDEILGNLKSGVREIADRHYAETTPIKARIQDAADRLSKVGAAPAEAPAAAAPEYSAEDLRQKYGISEMQSLKDLANRKLIELQDNGRWRVTPEGERHFEAQKKSLSPVKSRSEGIFPGMEEDVARQAEGAARVKGEDLTREANTPQNIDRAAGEMETKSPLFRGTAASPQKEMFMAGETAEPEPRPKMEGIFGVIADMERARENRPANTPEEDQAAETLVKNTIEALQSGDRPGRYFAEVPPGEYNLKTSAEKGVTRSGHWYGVKSARGMMGWLARHPWTATQMEKVLKAGPKSGMYRQMMDAAADWLRTRGESGRVREPGED